MPKLRLVLHHRFQPLLPAFGIEPAEAFFDQLRIIRFDVQVAPQVEVGAEHAFQTFRHRRRRQFLLGRQGLGAHRVDGLAFVVAGAFAQTLQGFAHHLRIAGAGQGPCRHAQGFVLPARGLLVDHTGHHPPDRPQPLHGHAHLVHLLRGQAGLTFKHGKYGFVLIAGGAGEASRQIRSGCRGFAHGGLRCWRF